MSLERSPMILAHEPVRRVADSGAKAHQALGCGHERLRRAIKTVTMELMSWNGESKESQKGHVSTFYN